MYRDPYGNYPVEARPPKRGNKVLRVWNPRRSPETYEYLDHAVKHAMELSLEFNNESVVTLDKETKLGDVISSVKVVIIRGAKFDKFGRPK